VGAKCYGIDEVPVGANSSQSPMRVHAPCGSLAIFGTRRAITISTMLDPIADNISRYMDLLSFRQKLVASNIANVDTPNYHTKDIDFASELQSAAGGQTPAIIEPAGLQTKTDGNNVALDRESRLLAENALRFNMASNLMKAQIRLVKAAIQDGR
jgi:flagellar basal-body rod protein FlgB